jgi:hypothetical protein
MDGWMGVWIDRQTDKWLGRLSGSPTMIQMERCSASHTLINRYRQVKGYADNDVENWVYMQRESGKKYMDK